MAPFPKVAPDPSPERIENQNERLAGLLQVRKLGGTASEFQRKMGMDAHGTSRSMACVLCDLTDTS